jgi:hypothetical protein
MKRARPLLARLSLLCAGFLMGAAANAGNIRGSWDPQFNSTFTGVGFRGEITFFVPDDCLSGPPGTTAYRDDGHACSTDGMDLVDAEVVLYEYPNINNIQSTITFAPPVQSPDPILGILVEYDATGAGTVVGLDTGLIGPQPSNQVPGPYFASLPSDFPDDLFLQFSSGFLESFPFSALTPGGAYLVPASCTPSDIEGEPLCIANYSEGALSNRGVVAFAAPEPGSLALLLSAMGVGWLARRRIAAQ